MEPFSDTVAITPKRKFRQRILLGVISFALGAGLGVFARRSEGVLTERISAGHAEPSANSTPGTQEHAPDRPKQLADQRAQLLVQLKSTPNDPELLAKLGYIYLATRDFKEASAYFKRSGDIKNDPIVRTELGRAYYYAGNPDEALAEFENVLKSDPDNANAMFNLGMVKWQAKFDVNGALAAWEQLLTKYPNHPRRADVEQLIARAKQHRVLQQQGAAGNTTK